MKRLFVCRFRQATGLPCPSCGSTRAMLALLRLDVPSALKLSPVAVTGGALLLAREIGRLGRPRDAGSRSAPSLEFVVVVLFALGLLRALLVAFRVRTPFTTPHISADGANAQ